MNNLRLRHFAVASGLLVLIGLGLGPQPVAAAETVTFEGSFAAGDLEWRDTGSGWQAVHPDTRALAETGAPQVPYIDLSFLVPRALKVVDIEIEVLQSHRQSVPGPLALGQLLQASTGEFVTVQHLRQEGEVFPEIWGEFGGQQIWRGYGLASVRVYPVRAVLAADGQYSEVEILDRYRVRMIGVEGTVATTSAERQRLVKGERLRTENILRQTVANPQALGAYQRQDGMEIGEPRLFEPTRSPSLTGSAVEYLIVTTEALAEPFQRLADFKTAERKLLRSLRKPLARKRHRSQGRWRKETFGRDA